MTEDEARERVRVIAGPAGHALIERYVDLVIAESTRQNLVSAASLAAIWDRHILDSAQLADMVGGRTGHWIDIGSGAGLPGIVLACMDRWRVTMIEPRRGRAEFLQACIDTLGLDRASAVKANAQAAAVDRADVISARAVGPIGDIFTMSRGFSDSSTQFVLPRGSGAAEDIANAARDWHGMFHVEHSVTQAGAGIVIADKVRPR